MVTVEDLRDELKTLGLTEDETETIKGKSNLIAKIEELRVGKETGELFEEAEVQEETSVLPNQESSNSVGDVNIPDVTDVKWGNYVLSHLKENEKIKGHPKADSLRRLTELLLCPILTIDTVVPQCPSLENGGRATVVVKVTLENGSSATGAADVYPGNTEQLFAKFPVATAETRAEGRAYRKILRLINVITAEELVDEKEIYDPADKIDEAQLMMINQMCSTAKLNINIKLLLKRHDIDVDTIDRTSKSKAKEICQIINSYQEIGVPEGLVGYETNWR